MNEIASTGIAYKILTAEQMDELLGKGTFAGAPIDVTDGYIHLSDAGQVNGTLDKHFAGQDNLFLAAVNLDALEGAIRWEVARGGALFPHLYGELPLSAIIGYGPVTRSETGELVLPGHAGQA
ncbi:DUF952 domain-containing protein [Novosphingobium sp. 1949]|uniref:DUF952 domain-containing protein n=1 Tax=Novosphingobium organovorum TaxID=2930092 RepID=A0ABT0B9A9_9SPHN|nr:DUF952 domain-containing protein [Novosphingobium organovorum]MCJ2181426.1 DUF952 domain-containing protein [Novosphingobium organovorum]